MPKFELVGTVTQRVERVYRADDMAKAIIGDGELLSETLLDEIDFKVDEAEEIE